MVWCMVQEAQFLLEIIFTISYTYYLPMFIYFKGTISCIWHAYWHFGIDSFDT
jgi:hypothetical protein